MTFEELSGYVVKMGEARFRAKQIFEAVAKGAEDIDCVRGLSKKLKERLKKDAFIYLPKIARRLISSDGTVKYIFELSDKNIIETVAMRYHHGLSVCVSSQVGCAMGCSFCASTLHGRVRNLSAGEILGQITAVTKDLGERVASVVIMGIGEPLDNYDNFVKFLKIATDGRGLNLGARHITVSTCGLASRIYQLADEGIPINLAISLHAPDDGKRRAIMPIAKKYRIEEIIDAARYYFNKTGRRVSYEYALIKGKNSSDEDAEALGRLLSGENCHVNLIPVNEVKERGNESVSRERVERFKSLLEKMHITATVRRELGSDISASCGQLRNSVTEGLA